MGRKYVKDYADIIIPRYIAGETARDIAKDLPFHESAVAKFIKNQGLSRKGKSFKRIKSEEQIVDDFKTGQYYCEDLAKKYDLNVHTIYEILDEAGIKRQTGFRSNCNIDYFEKIDSPNKAYLLGFITADGAVVDNQISIEIKEKDSELLEFAKKEINPKATIIDCNYLSSSNGYKYQKHNKRISFSASKLGKDLAKYGVVQNKSKILTRVPIEYIPENLLPFYFRGLIDGDGCIHKDGKISIYSGSYDFIKDVQTILIKSADLTKLKIYHGTSYFITWNSIKDRINLYQYLYSDLNATFYFKRKYNRLYDSIKQYVNTEVNN